MSESALQSLTYKKLHSCRPVCADAVRNKSKLPDDFTASAQHFFFSCQMNCFGHIGDRNDKILATFTCFRALV